MTHDRRAESLHHSIMVAGCKAVIFSSSLSGAVSDIFSLLLNGTRVCYPTYYTGTSDTMASVPGSKNMDSMVRGMSDKPVSNKIQDSINFKDKLMYIYTSGTTGMPKVKLSFINEAEF